MTERPYKRLYALSVIFPTSTYPPNRLVCAIIRKHLTRDKNDTASQPIPKWYYQQKATEDINGITRCWFNGGKVGRGKTKARAAKGAMKKLKCLQHGRFWHIGKGILFMTLLFAEIDDPTSPEWRVTK